MGIVGPLAAYIVYTSLNKINLPEIVSLIFAVFFANVFTIAATALEYSLAFGVADFLKFFIILGVTKVIFVVIDIIVAVILFVILKPVYKDSGLFSPELNDFFINKAHIALTNGISYCPGLEGFMRLNAACPRSILQQAMEQLKEAISSL